MVHIVSHDSKVQGRFVLVGMDNHMVVAFVDKLASSIEDLIVLLFHARFLNTQLSQTVELQQLTRMQLQPMQLYMTNHMRFLCYHGVSVDR